MSRSASLPTRRESVGRLCTRATCTCTGPATRSWLNDLRTRSMITRALWTNRFTIFSTTEIATSPKAWSTWLSMSASLHRRTGSARSSTTRRRISPPIPTPTPPRKAIAAAHGVAVDHVLPTAGAAEAFTLLARAFRPEQPLIIHPQFTEPEAALIAAGHRPKRLILSASTEFTLDSDQVPAASDFVMIGNPTNPTGALHPAAVITSLRRPGRILVIDEAFMDCVPGETETMIGNDMTGLLVLRSLTKTWGLAGLRAGYVIGDPTLIAAMQRQQPPWSVSTPALAATVGCLTPDARIAAAEAANRDRRAPRVPGGSAGAAGAHGGRPAPGVVRARRHQRRTR